MNDSLDTLVDTIADRVATEVVRRLESRLAPVAAPTTPAARDNVAPIRPAGKPLTEKQHSLLSSWRNQRQLEAAMTAVCGESVAIDELTSSQASEILDFMLGPKRAAVGARR
jgi:hypothetical protein